MARRTVLSFLLAALVGLGILAWDQLKVDDCDRAGSAGASMTVPVGTTGRKREQQVVPCSNWLPRQPRAVQAWCLVELSLVAVFGLSLAADVVRGRAALHLERRRL